MSRRERDEPRGTVTIGELFPADDLLARWVFSLSAAVEDLTIAEQRLVDELDSPVDPFSMVSTSFHFRQLVARLYEAERPVHAVELHGEVREFLDGVPDAREPLEALNLFYLPWSATEESPVRQLFGGARHLTVHHSWPGSVELRQALKAVQDLGARVLVDNAETRLSYEWVEVVALGSVVSELDTPDATSELRARTAVAQDIINKFAALLRCVLPAHCVRLGIEPARLL